MEVDWRLYAGLADLAADRVTVSTEDETVAGALEALLAEHPDLGSRLLAGEVEAERPAIDRSDLASDVAVLRNGTDLRAAATGADDLDQPIASDDELTLLPAISGG